MDRQLFTKIIEKIDAFDVQCSEARSTDTGDAWILLDDIKEELEKALDRLDRESH